MNTLEVLAMSVQSFNLSPNPHSHSLLCCGSRELNMHTHYCRCVPACRKIGASDRDALSLYSIYRSTTGAGAGAGWLSIMPSILQAAADIVTFCTCDGSLDEQDLHAFNLDMHHDKNGQKAMSTMSHRYPFGSAILSAYQIWRYTSGFVSLCWSSYHDKKLKYCFKLYYMVGLERIDMLMEGWRDHLHCAFRPFDVAPSQRGQMSRRTHHAMVIVLCERDWQGDDLNRVLSRGG